MAVAAAEAVSIRLHMPYDVFVVEATCAVYSHHIYITCHIIFRITYRWNVKKQTQLKWKRKIHIICFIEGNYKTTNISDSMSMVWERFPFSSLFEFVSNIFFCLIRRRRRRLSLPILYFDTIILHLIVGLDCHFQEHRFFIFRTHTLSVSQLLSPFQCPFSYLVFSFPNRKHSSFALHCVLLVSMATMAEKKARVKQMKNFDIATFIDHKRF